MTKFITINTPTVYRLAHVVADCGSSRGFEEFYKVRRVGNSVLIAQCCHKYDHFLSLSEYGKDVNCGFLSTPEGTWGKGWR